MDGKCWSGIRRALCAALLAGAALAGAAASASARTAALPMVGVDATTVMTLAAEDRCLMVSDDRGQSWTEHPGLCFAQSYRRARLGGAMIVADQSNARILRVRPDGTSAVIAVSPHGSFAGLVGGDTRGYVIDREPGVLLVRSITDGGFGACGPLVDVPFQTTDLTLLARGDGPVLALRTPGGENRILISTDDCATWSPLAPVAEGCRVVDAGPDALYATCGDPAERITHRLSRDSGTWQPAHPLLAQGVGSTERVRFVEQDGALRALDRLTSRGDPVGWPAAPVPSAQPGFEHVFEWVNQRYRRPLGLPDLSHDPALAAAAQGHAAYWTQNGYSGHGQQAGNPGFTGVQPWDRCAAAGALSCGEVATTASDPLTATDLWLRTPFHGEPFFSLMTMAVGNTSAGTVVNYEVRDRQWTHSLARLRPGAPLNSSEAMLRVWPHQGADDVPLRWAGNETPDPLINYVGDRSQVGPMIFGVFFEPATISLWGPDGRVPLLVPNAVSIVDEYRRGPIDGQGAYNPVSSVFAARPLAADTCHVVRVEPDAGPVTMLRFRSDGPGSADQCAPLPIEVPEPPVGGPGNGGGDPVAPTPDGDTGGGPDGGAPPPQGPPSGGGQAPSVPAAPGVPSGGTIAGVDVGQTQVLATALTATHIRARVVRPGAARVAGSLRLGRRTISLPARPVPAGRAVWIAWPRPSTGLVAGNWTLRLASPGSSADATASLRVRPAPRLTITPRRSGGAVVVRLRSAVAGVAVVEVRRGGVRATIAPRAVRGSTLIRVARRGLTTRPGAVVRVQVASPGRATAIRTATVR